MAVQVDEVARRVEQLSQGLREAGLRLTHQRLEIVRVIAADETHPDVETVYRAVRERVPTISLDTVYRTLATLTERGSHHAGHVHARVRPATTPTRRVITTSCARGAGWCATSRTATSTPSAPPRR